MKPEVADSHAFGACALSLARFDGDSRRWDAFVGEAEGSTFCHLAGWGEIMADVLGHDCIYLVAKGGDGRWEGVLPLVRVRSRFFGHYLVSMPFLNYGGPLGTPSAQVFLAEQAVEEASRSGADLLELRARQTLPSGLGVSDRKITVLLDLPQSPEALWGDVFRAKLRSQIRRPQNEGMEVRFGTSEVEPFYEVFTRNMRDLGTPVLPRKLFDRIGELFAGIVMYGVVYLRGEPVAAGCGFLWLSELELTWASAIRKYNRLAPNMLLYWSFIEEAIARRASVFNFGRCTPGGGTHRFKLQWGGRDVPLPWAQWSPRGVAATPSPDRLLYRLASGVWSHFPLPLANRIGPVLARRLP